MTDHSIRVSGGQTKRAASKVSPKSSSKADADKLLVEFLNYVSSIRILDPACGSGNFLYVALRKLLDLWLEARDFAVHHGIDFTIAYAADRMVSPHQLFGIEVDSYAHELASVVVWIGFLQWKIEHGVLVDREPILQKMRNIERGDAIMRYNEQTGAPYEPTWPAAEFIIGNPPFLGDKKLRRELDTPEHPCYTSDLRALYDGRVPGSADLVTYWFEKARQQIVSGRTKRAGLLATNSIRMVGNRPALERIKDSGDIFMAWSDRPWVLDGAAVRVSIVGFDDGTEENRTLNGTKVGHIHADLTADSNLVGALRLRENEGLCFLGVMKGGPFDIAEDEARKMLSRPLNPNGRPNSDVVKRRLVGRDVAGRNRHGWIIDFEEMSHAEACLYEWPFEYVKERVKPLRDRNRDKSMNTNWWLHGRSRPALRHAVRKIKRCIVTPEVAKHRLFVWMDTTVIPDHTCHVIARQDDYFFGVLHSLVHEQWSLSQGAWMGVGNDPRYSSARTFDTFPFPWPPGREPSETEDSRVAAIADAARNLSDLRLRWLSPPGACDSDLKSRTLTNLYNQRPEWLANAHERLDRAVFGAYGLRYPLQCNDILGHLLALNHERAAGYVRRAASDSPPKKAPEVERPLRRKTGSK